MRVTTRLISLKAQNTSAEAHAHQGLPSYLRDLRHADQPHLVVGLCAVEDLLVVLVGQLRVEEVASDALYRLYGDGVGWVPPAVETGVDA